MGDKRRICSLLPPVVQATRAGQDVTELEYVDNEYTDDAIIRIIWADGSVTRVDVTADSGISMIRDVLKHI